MEKTVPSCISRKGNRVKKKKTCKEVGNNKKKKNLGTTSKCRQLSFSFETNIIVLANGLQPKRLEKREKTN